MPTYVHPRPSVSYKSSLVFAQGPGWRHSTAIQSRLFPRILPRNIHHPNITALLPTGLHPELSKIMVRWTLTGVAFIKFSSYTFIFIIHLKCLMYYVMSNKTDFVEPRVFEIS